MLSELYANFTPYEWILSNTKGGYALGTAFLANVRKYHGLLVAGGTYGKRFHLLSSIEERVLFPSGLSYYLDTNFYRDVLYPEGYKLIKDFYFKPYPMFIFQCPLKREVFLEKTLQFHEGKNALLITYRNPSAYPFKLFLRPKFSFRDHHDITSFFSWQDYVLETNKQSAFLSKDDLAIFLYFNKGVIKVEPIFYYQVYYPLEELRGYEAYEDLFAPFLLEVELLPKESLRLLFCDHALKNPENEVLVIESRYTGYPKPDPKRGSFSERELPQILEEMLRDFLLEEDIIAGYPWFYCWGRDTFVGLPALFYLKEGKDLSLRIIQAYSDKRHQGLIPNVLGLPEEMNYNSLDGTLWFMLRIFEYVEFFGRKVGRDTKYKLFQIVEESLYEFFTNYNLPFFVDQEEGFLEIPDNINLSLTWMDVILDGRPLTPRYGKPIEISALWHNVLVYVLKYFKRSFIRKFSLEELVNKQNETFKKYFGEDLIADRLYQGKPIFEVRPNFVIALGLPYTPAPREVFALADRLVREELLTPFGLRSLSPRHPAFKRKYFGNQYQRDLAYHNGSVWVWLLLPYVKMLSRFLSENDYVEVLKRLVQPFRKMILSGKVGSLPELYDGDNPYYPKGAPAQFWSVASIFLLEKELEKKLRGGRK
ncbi:MAG: amylo-alpha-1,6-glucosidase [Caldimicrobium sp.]|nr:amylo-alpha-1,6-glucosidase [Caldimicrobium sp.]MCX7874029.1 amylo-alpha-1,6-glucosidase [Caldimicrobium sp.]MDW8093853.1 amylo-alpha-1,6-glucosidase [Caldimicrobium sp.]